MDTLDGIDRTGMTMECSSLEDLKKIAKRILEEEWRPAKYFSSLDLVDLEEDPQGHWWLGWIICRIVSDLHPHMPRSIIEDSLPGSPRWGVSEATVTGFYHTVPSLRDFYLKHNIDPDRGFCMWDANSEDEVPLVDVGGLKYHVLHAPPDTVTEGGEVVLIPTNLLRF